MSTILYICSQNCVKLIHKDEQNGKYFINRINDSLLFHMRQLHQVIFRIANQRIEEYSIPIKMEQMPILMSLYVLGDLSLQELADKIKRDKSSVSRTSSLLYEKGLIKYKKDEADARKKLLSLTNTGKFVALQIEDSVKEIEEEISNVLTNGPKSEFIQILKSATEKLEKLTNS